MSFQNAGEAGIAPSCSRHPGTRATATCERWIGYLDEVTVQGVSARHVECAVTDDLAGAEGLRGLSFLARFEMLTDPAKGVLTLVDRRAAAP